MKKLFFLLALACSCGPHVPVLNDSMAEVRDYVPRYAVMAHRGSTYWAPEETESAWRWAREMGADYLESDLQCTKDGVILANHDVNLTRTTDIATVFGEGLPAGRKDFYKSLGFSEEDALAQCQRDLQFFQPYQASSYYYAELLTLDAGSWFNTTRPEQARPAFAGSQYVSALQDQIAYAEGKRLSRDAAGRRVLPLKLRESCAGKTLGQLSAEAKEGGKYMEIIDYDFSSAYEPDPADTGNRPGIYIEFKEPEVNPEDMEQRVYDVLDAAGWNILTKPATETAFLKDGKVNVGQTNGKVILQTFSRESLCRANSIFKGRVPMCFLLWRGDWNGELDKPVSYADIITWAQNNGAHIIGPSISGAPNDYEELDAQWQADIVHKAAMLNHPYSFDTLEQMEEHALRSDGYFTNRSELTLSYLIEHGLRSAEVVVPDAEETLSRLGY
ncbi:MAG: glycerophosphodiester phosphodiesterase [Bacteroidales bacterium]|nr:glycerophosphodiester phosphodiesterase [Bacteroidales bacterium]